MNLQWYRLPACLFDCRWLRGRGGGRIQRELRTWGTVPEYLIVVGGGDDIVGL